MAFSSKVPAFIQRDCIAEKFVRQKDKEFLKNNVKKLKTEYRSVYKKEANDDSENLVEIVIDALTITDKVEEEGVGYLRFCSVKQIKSMFNTANI